MDKNTQWRHAYKEELYQMKIDPDTKQKSMWAYNILTPEMKIHHQTCENHIYAFKV